MVYLVDEGPGWAKGLLRGGTSHTDPWPSGYRTGDLFSSTEDKSGSFFQIEGGFQENETHSSSRVQLLIVTQC